MKKDTLQFYKKPELKIYGTVHEMTKQGVVTGSSSVELECPPGTGVARDPNTGKIVDCL